jgi:DNA-directed RNA polymerase I subunit RPA1
MRMQVVPVPPNRFRPPSYIGDAAFEHPHNIALTRVPCPVPAHALVLP